MIIYWSGIVAFKMPPKKKSAANGKNGKEKEKAQKRASVGSEGKEGAATPKTDESKSIDEYSEVGEGVGSRRTSLDRNKDGGLPTGIDAEAKELEDMKASRQKLERTTSVLNKHDLVVQKLIMKAREDLVRRNETLW